MAQAKGRTREIAAGMMKAAAASEAMIGKTIARAANRKASIKKRVLAISGQEYILGPPFAEGERLVFLSAPRLH